MLIDTYVTSISFAVKVFKNFDIESELRKKQLSLFENGETLDFDIDRDTRCSIEDFLIVNVCVFEMVHFTPFQLSHKPYQIGVKMEYFRDTHIQF